jgi:hypothetical protein
MSSQDFAQENNAFLKRRGLRVLNNLAPNSVEFHERVEWHKKFVETLDMKTITEDQRLQKGI